MFFKKIKAKYFLIIILFFAPFFANAVNGVEGKILIQTEESGEAWYVYPQDGKRYYLGRPADAFVIMRLLSLGTTHEYINDRSVFPERLAGMILLDTESHGEAYYIHPEKLTKHYLGRPADAFGIMREFGLGATNLSLLYIPVGYTAESADLEEMNISASPQEVPFTSQAPFGDWEDQRQQDGCEEASSLMAVKWDRERSLTREEALDNILGASDYLQEKYGEYRDVSARDTVDWIFKDYFNYENVALKENVKVDDIIRELAKGNVIVAPMDGRELGNPNFTPPGPSRHMLLIKGYDSDRHVFITNDPGTRKGENYEYDARILFEAIRDYPTGYHEAIEEPGKNVIVVWKTEQ
ncbi:MAG: C39 family peptidase [Patescibacteria group bacterium]